MNSFLKLKAIEITGNSFHCDFDSKCATSVLRDALKAVNDIASPHFLGTGSIAISGSHNEAILMFGIKKAEQMPNTEKEKAAEQPLELFERITMPGLAVKRTQTIQKLNEAWSEDVDKIHQALNLRLSKT